MQPDQPTFMERIRKIISICIQFVQKKRSKPTFHVRVSDTEVGIADLVKCLHLLAPTEMYAASIAANLGFEWRAREVPMGTSSPNSKDNSTLPQRQDTIESNDGLDLTPKETNEDVEAYDDLPPLLKPISKEPLRELIQFGGFEAESIEAVQPTDIEVHHQRLEYQSLMRDEWFRAICSSLLATDEPTRELDSRVIEKSLTNGRPLTYIPWRRRKTTRRGVAVLLDRSESMQPFWRDEDEIVARLNRVLGRTRVLTFRFVVDPWSTAIPCLKWSGGRPSLLPGMPCLVISDFGLSEDSHIRSHDILPRAPWSEIIAIANAYLATLSALIPVPEREWPAGWRHSFPRAFEWDRATSPALIQRRLSGLPGSLR